MVAIDPNNGQILAMASQPVFRPECLCQRHVPRQWNALISNPFRPMENKAIQGEYPPASTYKIVTAMAGLEEGVIDETTTFYCPGHYQVRQPGFPVLEKGGGTVR